MKSVQLLLITLFLTASLAFSTETRIRTLGNANNIVKDDYNIWVFPQAVSWYQNRVKSEIGWRGSIIQHTVGGHYAVKNSAFGIYLTSDDKTYDHAPIIGANNNYSQKIDLFAGNEYHGTSAGLHISINGQSQLLDYGDSEREISLTDFGVGIGATIDERIDAFASMNIVSWTDDDSGKTLTSPDGYLSFKFGGRSWHELSDYNTIIPFLSFELGGKGYKRENQPGGTNLRGKRESFSEFVLGVGNNLIIDDKTLLVNSVGMRLQSGELKTTYRDSTTTENASFSSFPFYQIGIEAPLLTWLDIRIGSQKSWSKYKSEPANAGPFSPNVTTGISETELLAGVGIHWGGFIMDFELNPGFILQGTYLVSGRVNDLSNRLSIVYMWDVETPEAEDDY